MKFKIINFQANSCDWWLRYLLWNCPQTNVTEPYWWLVNIGSGNGLVQSGNKPLPEPMLTQISLTIWSQMTALIPGARDVAMTCLYSLELTNVLKCIDVNINDEDYEMTRPLYWAVRGGHVKVVKLLLEAGAAKTWLNVFGDSAVHIAVRYQQEPTLRLLMEKGCSVNVISKSYHWPSAPFRASFPCLE